MCLVVLAENDSSRKKKVHHDLAKARLFHLAPPFSDVAVSQPSFQPTKPIPLDIARYRGSFSPCPLFILWVFKRGGVSARIERGGVSAPIPAHHFSRSPPFGVVGKHHAQTWRCFSRVTPYSGHMMPQVWHLFMLRAGPLMLRVGHLSCFELGTFDARVGHLSCLELGMSWAPLMLRVGHL